MSDDKKEFLIKLLIASAREIAEWDVREILDESDHDQRELLLAIETLCETVNQIHA